MFKSLGLDLSTATGIFYRQALRYHGLPFEVQLDEEPNECTYAAMQAAEDVSIQEVHPDELCHCGGLQWNRCSTRTAPSKKAFTKVKLSAHKRTLRDCSCNARRVLLFIVSAKNQRIILLLRLLLDTSRSVQSHKRCRYPCSQR